jgi:hypothetical protein
LTEEEGCLKGWRPLREKLHAVTLNNLGCFFKRRGRLQAALHYLTSAAVVEAASDAAENPAGTMLNLCAVLSQVCAVRKKDSHHHGSVMCWERPSASC